MRISFLIAAACAGPAGCSQADSAPTPAAEPAQWFVDAAPESGLEFTHATGASGQFYFPEIAASGCGFLDYDGDGDLDVYAVQAHELRPDGPAGPGGADRLFRNDLTVGPDGARRMRLVDVTARSGLGDPGYGMGLATGDYDNDGDVDLYVTNFGPNRLYRNDGGGRFTDVSAGAIPPEDRWSTSAAFVDYDGDGFLDLFVCNYVDFSVRENKVCHSPSGRRDYCGPQSFAPVPDRLFRNNGDGTFRDATVEAGIDRAFGAALGVVCADFDGDGRTDIYVANDGDANQLWINQGDGTFRDEALVAGAAYNAEGEAEAGMGVDAADFDSDGDLDIFLAHLTGEHNTLFVNDGAGFFEDRTEEFGLSSPGWRYTGFGTGWADFDGDGLLDLFVANGAVTIVEELAADPYPYGNPNLLLRNVGPPRYAYGDVSAGAGAMFAIVETSRGAAFGDVDNDGDTDVLVSTSNGPQRLLRNDRGSARPWLSLRLIGREGRDAFGAVARLAGAGRQDILRRVHTDGSYCSANDPRVLFALPDERPADVTVAWPGGLVESFPGLPARTHATLREGTGIPVP